MIESKAYFTLPPPSFPNSIWERHCLRNSIAQPGKQNGIVRARAFPNGVWERGIIIRFFTLAFAFAVFSFSDAVALPQNFPSRNGVLTQADIDYFFDSSYLKNGKSIFQLSKNTSGLPWKLNTLTGSKVTTSEGTCHYNDQLALLHGASLEIKGQDFSFLVMSGPDYLTVLLYVSPKDGGVANGRRAFLKANSDSRYVVAEIAPPVLYD